MPNGPPGLPEIFSNFFDNRKKEAEATATARAVLKRIDPVKYDEKTIQDMDGKTARASALAEQIGQDFDYQKLQKRQMDQAYEKGKMEMQEMVRGREDKQVFNQSALQQDIPPMLAQRMQAMQPGAPAGFGGMDQEEAMPGPRAAMAVPDQTPALLRQRLASSGMLTPEIDFRLQALEQQSDSRLPLGRTMPVPGMGTFLGTGGAPHFMPNKTDTPPTLYTAVDPTTGKPIPGMALSESGAAVQTGEKGGLKDLSQTEVDRLGALEQAGHDLEDIETIFKAVSDSTTGPVIGRARRINAYDENRILLEQAVKASVPNLARGVMKEVGTLTDQDRAVFTELYPTLKDPPAIREKKLKYLRKRITEGSKTTMEQLKKSGRDLTGYEKSSEPAPAEGQIRFQNEAEARTAGRKTGDVVELYIPERGGYVKVRLK